MNLNQTISKYAYIAALNDSYKYMNIPIKL